jgi:hypothetical protein
MLLPLLLFNGNQLTNPFPQNQNLAVTSNGTTSRHALSLKAKKTNIHASPKLTN